MPSAEIGRGKRDLGIETSGPEKSSPAPGSNDPIYGMERSSEMSSIVQEDTSEPPQDGTAPPGAPGHVSRCWPDSKVSCTSSEIDKRSCTLALTAVDEGRPTLRVAPASLPFTGVDHGGCEPQASQPDTEQSSNEPGGSPGSHITGQKQGEGQTETPAETYSAQEGDSLITRVDLQRQVTELVLANPNNWCFANALAYSLLWCTLAVRSFELAFWGEHQDPLLNFLAQAPGHTCSLADAQFFRQILSCWGHHELLEISSIGQQDASECAHVWLRLLRSPLFDMRWEKRMYVADAPHVMDSNPEATMPICLRFDPAKIDFELCDFTGLALTWNQVDGMSTSLLTGSPCLCVHVDRCSQGPDGLIGKIQSALACDDECYVPVLASDGRSCFFQGYTIVAVMAHLGSDGSGHYRAGLKLRPAISDSVHPLQWLLTDDWRAPEATWLLPDWILCNITMAWMVRSDLVSLPFHQKQPMMHPHSMTHLLGLLADDAQSAEAASTA